MEKAVPVAHRTKREQTVKTEGVKFKVVSIMEVLWPNKDQNTVEKAKFEQKETDRLQKTDRIQLQKHRANIKEILLSSNATPIRTHTGKGYVCCYCDDAYLAPADLKKHTSEAHVNISEAYFMKKLNMYDYYIKLDITLLRCNICKYEINTLEHLMDHLRIEHNKTLHTDIKNHIMPFKFNTETLQCFMCMNVFDKFKMLLEHMYNVHYRNYVCDVCEAGFVSSGRLYHHTYIHKTGVFNCEHCPKVFDTNLKKKQHVRTSHSILVHKCAYCNETFNDYRKREAHLVSDHGMAARATSKCQACDKEFQYKSQLRKHIKKDHLMDRPHECSECDMKFFTRKSLKDHSLKHSGLRSYQCAVCLKCFKRKYTLKEHMRIHEDDRRFKCEHCGQAFVQKCSWKGHMRSKHGEIL